MAIELLTKDAIEGKVKHLYRHDAESFLWVLAWVSLRYKTGQLLNRPRPLDQWLSLDAIECRKEKNDFLNTGRHYMKPSRSHKDSWKVVRHCFELVRFFHAHKPPAGEPVDSKSEDSDESESDGSETDGSKADGANVSEAHRHVSASSTDAAMFKMWIQIILRAQLTAEFRDVRVEPTS
jgi:hypothetical protein